MMHIMPNRSKTGRFCSKAQQKEIVEDDLDLPFCIAHWQTRSPATGRLAAWCCAARTCSPSAAAISGQRGAATGALIGQRLGAVVVVSVQPTHHGLRVAARARRHLRGAGAFSDIMQGQEPLAAAAMRGIEGQLTQIRLRLAPTVVVNS